MDVLTDVIRTLGMECRLLTSAQLTSPAYFPATRAGTGMVHFAASSCQLIRTGAPPLYLDPGSLVLLLEGGAHTLGGIDKSSPTISGEIVFSRGLENPLTKRLPPVLVMTFPPGTWQRSALDHLLDEVAASLPGHERVCERLADLLIILALRDSVKNDVTTNTGSMRGLADPDVGQVLRLIHERPDVAWTVGALAKKVALSRSTFAAKFKTIVGDTPLGYLTWWRMQRAAARLRDEPETSMAVIALGVGYQTESAFGKAFKQQLGVTPGTYRRTFVGSNQRPPSVLQRELRKRNSFDLPEEEVALNLIRTSMLYGAAPKELLEAHGLGGSRYNILRILRGNGAALSLPNIISCMVTKPDNIEEQIAGLKKAKLIKVSPVGLIQATPLGLKQLEITDKPLLAIHRNQLGHFSPSELDELNRLLVKARQRTATEKSSRNR
jgi:AraC-like DNA-binding protein/DNA-binding MarR family transcriptional regulator